MYLGNGEDGDGSDDDERHQVKRFSDVGHGVKEDAEFEGFEDIGDEKKTTKQVGSVK